MLSRRLLEESSTAAHREEHLQRVVQRVAAEQREKVAVRVRRRGEARAQARAALATAGARHALRAKDRK